MDESKNEYVWHKPGRSCEKTDIHCPIQRSMTHALKDSCVYITPLSPL